MNGFLTATSDLCSDLFITLGNEMPLGEEPPPNCHSKSPPARMFLPRMKRFKIKFPFLFIISGANVEGAESFNCTRQITLIDKPQSQSIVIT